MIVIGTSGSTIVIGTFIFGTIVIGIIVSKRNRIISYTRNTTSLVWPDGAQSLLSFARFTASLVSLVSQLRSFHTRPMGEPACLQQGQS